MTRLCVALGTVASVLSSGAAGAHPGHGAEGSHASLIHYLVEPIHFGALVAGGLGVLIAVSQLRRSRRRRNQGAA